MKVSIVLLLVAIAACISLAEETHHETSHSVAEGGGQHNKGGKSFDEGQDSHSGKSSKHDQESSKKGQDLKDVHKKSHQEKKGKKTTHHHQDSHKSSKHAAGGSHHDLKHSDAKKYKKAKSLKGFREKFHKDEEKKHDSFFSKGEKSGEYEVFGKKHSKYSSESYNKQNKRNHKNGASGKSGGKAYKSAKGHHEADHKAHQGQGGAESHYKNLDKFSKKRASHGGKKYKIIKL